MNPNLFLARTFVDELARGGVKVVCIAPGSRSTPLVFAFLQNPDMHTYIHLDERSASFFALGLALSTRQPVAVVCTSGSAAANFFPAIIEARMSGVPLLVLTADRPQELRGSGANQTIDQVKLYGDNVLWSMDLPTPEAAPSELVLRHIRTLAARAIFTATGLPKGPVHLNFPFRKPLEPDQDEISPDLGSKNLPIPPWTRLTRGELRPDRAQIEEMVNLIQSHPRGLIICGPRCPAGSFPSSVIALAHACGYPIFAESLSGLRFGPAAASSLVIGGYDTFLTHPKLAWEAPTLVLRFGGVPTSAALCAYLSRIRPAARILVAEDGQWADDDHRLTWLFQAEPALVCADITECLRRIDASRPADSEWLRCIIATEQQTWACINQKLDENPLSDFRAVARTLDLLPPDSCLFVGNSLPIRNIDQFGQPTAKTYRVFGSRGASGIDGNVSTALGIAAANPKYKVAAILGDITFYHDMNGLLAIRQHHLDNILFVVINNNGGGIFHRLPVAAYEPWFTQAFLTPHGLTFAPAAGLYGLDYAQITDFSAFNAALHSAITASRPALLEVICNSTNNETLRHNIINSVVNSL